MTRRPPARQVALALAATGAVLVGHLLDAFGLLPGVHESVAVRRASLAPTYDALTILGAGLLAVGVDSLLRRRRPRSAVLALIAGQTGLLGLLGSVQLISLCKDNLRIRWRVGPK